MSGNNEKSLVFKELERCLSEIRDSIGHAVDHRNDPESSAMALAAIEQITGRCCALLAYCISTFPETITCNSRVSIRDLIADSAERLKKTDKSGEIQFTQRISDNPIIWADPETLGLAFIALLQGMILSSVGTGRIEMQIEKENDRALIMITGPGARLGKWAHDILSKGEGVSEFTAGEGTDTGRIGLLGAIRIIELHGGTVAGEERREEEKILITLPTVKTGSSIPDNEKKTPKQQKNLPADFTVLVADDDGSIRELLRTIIKSIGVARIDGARDGDEALKLARENDYRAVFMDISMPGVSGIDVGRQIRAMKPSTKIIFITGLYQEEETIGRLLEKDAYAYIRKPFNIAAIKKIILNLSGETR